MKRRLFFLGIASIGAVSAARASGITLIDDMLTGMLPEVPFEYLDERVSVDPAKNGVDYPFYIERNGFVCEAVESFQVKAVVIDGRHEWFFENNLISSDLLLGWKSMSHPGIIREAEFKVADGKVDIIRRPNADNHLKEMALLSVIPDLLRTRSKVKKIRKGRVITLKGHLCNVKAADGVVTPKIQLMENGVQKWTAIIDQVIWGDTSV